MAEYSKDEIKRIEEKWRMKWQQNGVYKTDNHSDKPKYYVLDMFPYPSGAGLHVGHPLGYIASDIVTRYKRLKGFNVLHPMGFDAFGLPAEQYAIQTGQHPRVTTEKNMATYVAQLSKIGFAFDWDRKVVTSDPSYYKWTQWIFMQLFNAWYDRTANNKVGKARPMTELVAELEKNGNKNIVAVCDDETPTITAAQWAAFNENEKENFLQKYRIAYLAETMVNWCAALGTVLSNDEVKDGVSERGGYPVERIKMLQWNMRISAYAERLLTGLDTIDWPEPVKEMQRNWIGKSVGCELDFKLASGDDTLRVFTTRIDTIYGVTFMVIAPEHELVDKITTPAQRDEVTQYVEVAKNRSERERMSEVKRISGAFTGAYVINPFNHEKVPVWIADYVLAGYGTGAVMAVPSSDTRDYAFAKHFNLPIVDVLEGPTSDITKDNFEPKSGKMINSGSLNGLPWLDAIEKALQHVETLGIGTRKVNYRMRDAIFGRQRYWGEPFPVYFDKGIPKLVDEKDLPVTLPEIDAYKPTETGEPPLGRAKGWNYRGHSYELTTMPGWAGSSWYWFRYMDPQNDKVFASKEALDYWKDVDLYIGGSEHATGHLLYSRFWCKVMKDLGFVSSEEPFKKLINQGHIQGVSQKINVMGGGVEAVSKTNSVYPPDHSPAPYSLGDNLYNVFVSAGLHYSNRTYSDNVPIALVEDNILRDRKAYLDWRGDVDRAVFITPGGFWKLDMINGVWSEEFIRTTDGSFEFTTAPEQEKMSKSKYNVVNPDDIVDSYGADTLRMYEMFLGPLELSKPWNTNGIDGVFKFLRRFWNLFHDNQGNISVSDAEPSREELKVLHKTLKKIAYDIEHFSFNTSVSEFMICSNELSSMKSNKRAILEPLLITLAPFAPHIADELWEKLGHKESILYASFPQYNEEYLTESSFEYPISINGKVRVKMNFALDMPKDDIEKLVIASEVVQKWTEGKAPKKVIVVPGRIVNVVI